MTEIDLSRAEWHKSSCSGQSGNCVEVARNLPGLVAVRDSKNPDDVKLVVSPKTWRAFIRGSLTPRG
jgi:putative sterol carrier protein